MQSFFSPLNKAMTKKSKYGLQIFELFFRVRVSENIFKDVMLSLHRIVIPFTIINVSDVIYQEFNCRTYLYIGNS